jgi:uncharacterized membrane protein
MKLKLFMVIILCFFASSAFSCQRYKVFDLGTLETNQSEATQINDNTEVFGTYDNGAAFFWSPELGLRKTGCNLGPQKMNNLGQIACVRARVDYHNQYDVFITEAKTGTIVRSLGLRSGAQFLKIRALNNLGQIVFEDQKRLFAWNNKTIKPLGNLFDLSHDIGINDKSEIFGTVKASYGYSIARCYQLETDTVLDINPSMKANFFGLSINNISQGIVRWKSMNGEGAFQWPIGLALSVNARKINDKGQILEGSVGLREHGHLVDINKVLDLPNDNSTPFERIDYINDINNHGQMVGRGSVNGVRHAVLIVPMD